MEVVLTNRSNGPNTFRPPMRTPILGPGTSKRLKSSSLASYRGASRGVRTSTTSVLGPTSPSSPIHFLTPLLFLSLSLSLSLSLCCHARTTDPRKLQRAETHRRRRLAQLMCLTAAGRQSRHPCQLHPLSRRSWLMKRATTSTGTSFRRRMRTSRFSPRRRTTSSSSSSGSHCRTHWSTRDHRGHRPRSGSVASISDASSAAIRRPGAKWHPTPPSIIKVERAQPRTASSTTSAAAGCETRPKELSVDSTSNSCASDSPTRSASSPQGRRGACKVAEKAERLCRERDAAAGERQMSRVLGLLVRRRQRRERRCRQSQRPCLQGHCRVSRLV